MIFLKGNRQKGYFLWICLPLWLASDEFHHSIHGCAPGYGAGHLIASLPGALLTGRGISVRRRGPCRLLAAMSEKGPPASTQGIRASAVTHRRRQPAWAAEAERPAAWLPAKGPWRLRRATGGCPRSGYRTSRSPGVAPSLAQ